MTLLHKQRVKIVLYALVILLAVVLTITVIYFDPSWSTIIWAGGPGLFIVMLFVYDVYTLIRHSDDLDRLKEHRRHDRTPHVCALLSLLALVMPAQAQTIDLPHRPIPEICAVHAQEPKGHLNMERACQDTEAQARKNLMTIWQFVPDDLRKYCVEWTRSGYYYGGIMLCLRKYAQPPQHKAENKPTFGLFAGAFLAGIFLQGMAWVTAKVMALQRPCPVPRVSGPEIARLVRCLALWRAQEVQEIRMDTIIDGATLMTLGQSIDNAVSEWQDTTKGGS